MTQDGADGTRRRRRRATSPQGAPHTPAAAPASPEPAPVRKPRHKAKARAAEAAAKPVAKGRARDTRPKGTDRGLQDLVGGGPSQLGPDRAMRARDVNRPDADDLATAQRTLDIVRRNWRPQ